MADIFIEQLIQRKTTARYILIRVLYVFAYLVFCAVTLFLLSSAFIFAWGCGIWVLVILFRHLNVEFEYIMTNGELDIDRITGRSKRKRLLSLDCRSLEVCAPVDSEQFGKYESMDKKLDVSSGPGSPDRYFTVTSSKDGGRLLLIFEPDDRILAAMRTYNRNVR